MMKFGVAVGLYLFGASLIQNLCKELSKVPLIDYHAWGIRNFLCSVWLIICVLAAIFMPIDSSGQ